MFAFIIMSFVLGSVDAQCPPKTTSFIDDKGSTIKCSTVCPPAVSLDSAVEYCKLVCPEYFNCLISEFPFNHNRGEFYCHFCNNTLYYNTKLGIIYCGTICSFPPDLECTIRCPSYSACISVEENCPEMITCPVPYCQIDRPTTTLPPIEPTNVDPSTEPTTVDPCVKQTNVNAIILSLSNLLTFSLTFLVFALCTCKRKRSEQSMI